jgi:hypothetical protein
LHESEETSLRVCERWKPYSVTDYTRNINGSLNKLKFMDLNGSWKKLWLEAVNDFRHFPNSRMK